MAAAEELLGVNPELANVLGGRVYVDSDSHDVTLANGLWPERYFLLDGEVVSWASTLSFEERSTDLPQQLRSAAMSVWQE